MPDISTAVKETLAMAKRAMIFDFEGTPVYKYPDRNSELIGWLDMYTKIYIYNEYKDFYYTSCNFKFGYIPKSSVIMMAEEE